MVQYVSASLRSRNVVLGSRRSEREQRSAAVHHSSTNDNVLYHSRSRRTLAPFLRMPEPEVRHTTSTQPIRMNRFHARAREPLIGRQPNARRANVLGLRHAAHFRHTIRCERTTNCRQELALTARSWNKCPVFNDQFRNSSELSRIVRN